MEQSAFYLTLPSNVRSLHTSSDNTVANYITPLSQNLSLKGNWEVAITEIYYTKSWLTIEESPIKMLIIQKQSVFDPSASDFAVKAMAYQKNLQNELSKYQTINRDITIENIGTDPFHYITLQGKSADSKDLKLEPSNYKEEKDFIKMINDKLAKQVNLKVFPKVKLNEFTRTIRIDAGYSTKNRKVFPLFSKQVQEMMGISYYFEYLDGNPEHEIQGQLARVDYIKGNRPLDLSQQRHMIYVYSDIVAPSLVGDSFVPLLRVVEIPQEKAFGDTVTFRYQELQYHRLITKDFNTVEIDFRFDTGETTF